MSCPASGLPPAEREAPHSHGSTVGVGWGAPPGLWPIRYNKWPGSFSHHKGIWAKPFFLGRLFFVLNSNLHQRHLTQHQLGCVATEVANIRIGYHKDYATGVPNGAATVKTQIEAAKEVGISRRTDDEPPTLRQAVRLTAKLGGFLGRKCVTGTWNKGPLAWPSATRRPRRRVSVHGSLCRPTSPRPTRVQQRRLWVKIRPMTGDPPGRAVRFIFQDPVFPCCMIPQINLGRTRTLPGETTEKAVATSLWCLATTEDSK